MILCLGKAEWARELRGKISQSLVCGEVIGAKARLDPENDRSKRAVAQTPFRLVKTSS